MPSNNEKEPLDRAIIGAIARLEAAGSLSALSPVDQTISFSDAYRRIGATTAAARLDHAVAMFGLPEPHLFEERRQLRLEHLRNEAAWNDLNSQLCGDVTVWQNLDQYVREHGVAE
jgi:hypothetical protein